MRQYEVGETFVAAVEREAGPRAIDAAWRGPSACRRSTSCTRTAGAGSPGVDADRAPPRPVDPLAPYRERFASRHDRPRRAGGRRVLGRRRLRRAPGARRRRRARAGRGARRPRPASRERARRAPRRCARRAPSAFASTPAPSTIAPGSNLEARARDARYAALEAARVEHGADAVLVGHTADDQAETVLLNVLRGAAASGLAGMAARRGAVVAPAARLPPRRDAPRSATRSALAVARTTR